MNILEVFRIAVGALAENKLRSMLTLLAIVIGVFAVISSSTGVKVIERYFDDTMSVMGGSVINISTRPMVQTGDASRFRNRQRITFQQFEQLQERTELGRFMSPDVTFRGTRIESEEAQTNPNVPVYGGNEYWMLNNAYEIEEGRNFIMDDIQNARPVVVIGEDVRKSLFDNASPIGKGIRIDGQMYTVIGLAASKGNIMGSSLDNFVLAPYTRLGAVYGFNRNVSIVVQAPDILMINETIDELTGLFRVIRGIQPGEMNDFEIATNESLRGTFDELTKYLFIFGIIVGGIALLGAGIGVMNIMLVSVTERTREIGIRKSIGATRRAIVQQFLLETVVVCQIGGIIGIIVGIAGGNVLSIWMDTAFVIPWNSVIAGVGGMTLIGLVFGVYPALVAARLDPIACLRYE
ncbi:MAG: ABC transporter permease [Bacteroidetes bacterium]|nr:ABC transporter permease [Bacteroidota bacterium]